MILKLDSQFGTCISQKGDKKIGTEGVCEMMNMKEAGWHIALVSSCNPDKQSLQLELHQSNKRRGGKGAYLVPTTSSSPPYQWEPSAHSATIPLMTF